MPGTSQPSLPNEMYRVRRRFLSHILDMAAFVCAAFLAFELRFDGDLPAQQVHPMHTAMFIWVVLQSAAFIGCRVSWDHWRYTCTYDAARILVAGTIGSFLGGLVMVALLGPWGVPRSVYVLDWMLACLFTLCGRLAVRVVVTARTIGRN